MDRSTLIKYNMLKNNNIIYQYIWSIKNNNLRNAYINYLCVCLNKDDPYIINEYYTNSSVGMPRILNVIKAYVYFNHYHNMFEIQVFKNNSYIPDFGLITLQTLKPIIRSNSNFYKECVKYQNKITQLLYFEIFKMSLPKEINCLILYYLTGKPDKISSYTESSTSSCCSSHSRNISV